MTYLGTIRMVIGCAVFLLAGCQVAVDGAQQQEPPPELNAESEPPFASHEWQLAVVVQVAPGRIQAVSAEVVYQPAPPNAVIADLEVRLVAGERVEHVYSIVDPLVGRIEGRGTMKLDEAEIVLLVPLTTDFEILEIAPIEGRQGLVSSGGTITDFRDLVIEACEDDRARESGACDAVAEERGQP